MSKEWKLNCDDRGFFYSDETGKKSDYFTYADEYSDNFGVVRTKSGKYAYRDLDGNLSEEYDYCYRYSDGIGSVLKANGNCAFRDTKGNLSKDEYKFAGQFGSFYKGFVQVITLDGEKKYRDLKGNLYSVPMILYLFDKIDETELEDEDFANEKFLDMVIKRTKNITSQSIDLAENDEQLEASKDYYLDTMEYVLSKAYDAKVQKEELERKQREAEQLNNKKQKLLQELNLVD